MLKKATGSTYAENGGDIPGELKRFCRAKAAAGSQPVGKSIAGGAMTTYMKRNGYQMRASGTKQVNDQEFASKTCGRLGFTLMMTLGR